jgi:adenylosuccinate synthase
LKRIEDFPTLIKSEDPSFEQIKSRLEQEYQILAKDFSFGWTDLNLIRHADKINKLSNIMLTHLDVLNDLDAIKNE